VATRDTAKGLSPALSAQKPVPLKKLVGEQLNHHLTARQNGLTSGISSLTEGMGRLLSELGLNP
jgi:hypothetical protein